MTKPLFLVLLFLTGPIVQAQQTPFRVTAAHLSHASNQLKVAFGEIEKAKARNPKGVSPRSLREDTLFMVPASDWTSGFFAGNLWYMYELTRDKSWLPQARAFTAPLEGQKTNAGTHDMGFKMYCSFGNGWRLTQDHAYRTILLEGARTLTTRFNPTVGSIRSWDFSRDRWAFPVIIDNMMNLDLLFWAFRETNDSLFYKVATSHATTTMKNHYRADNSSYHVIDYDPQTGQVRKRETHQGYSNESAWARGQAWGLYGFTMCYRETKRKDFLEHAEKIAAYILKHPNLPTDLIPYWDFNAPDIPKAPRDASAASITASALYELSQYVPSRSAYYRNMADRIMQRLVTAYQAAPGTHKGFLLTHSTGHLPGKHEIDVPIIYADYYYLEAMVRRRALK